MKTNFTLKLSKELHQSVFSPFRREPRIEAAFSVTVARLFELKTLTLFSSLMLLPTSFSFSQLSVA